MSTVILIFAGIVVAFLIVVASQPATFRIARSAIIAAPPHDVFPLVNDFHNWDQWSPWAKLDPQMKATFEGPASGVGSMYSWVGDNKVGQGKMTILESRPNELVRIKLEFLKPFQATNTAEFVFLPTGTGTKVTWSMTGENNFMAKMFSALMNMDQMLGKDFEKGLTNLKAAAERKPVEQFAGGEHIVDRPPARLDRPSVETALLVGRVIVGFVFYYHGAQKLFGAFGGMGLAETVKFMGALGYLVAVGECLGGIGIMYGFLARFSAAANMLIMFGAIAMVHGKNGFSLEHQGFEYNLALIGLLLPVMLAGPGRISLGRYLPFPKSSATGRPIIILE